MTVCERYPALQHPTFSNDEDLGDSVSAGAEFQGLLDAWFLDHPVRKREVASDYNYGFACVANANPKLMARMHTPGRSNANLWQPSASDGHTFARPHAPQGQGTNATAATPAERAKAMAP